MQEDGRAFVTSAVVDGRACLRPCIVNFRTTRADVLSLVDLADELGRLASSEARSADPAYAGGRWSARARREDARSSASTSSRVSDSRASDRVDSG